MSSGLQVKLARRDEKIIIHLKGRIDGITLHILEEKLTLLLQEKKNFLLLDMAEVDHISSTGIRLLVEYTQKLKQLGGLFILFAIQEEVYEMIKLAGLQSILRIASSEKKALQMQA